MDKVLENMEKMPRFLVCFLNCKNLYFYIFFFLLFPIICYIHAPCKVMQSKFMSVKCLPDGELPEDEKRNLAVRGLLLAATEDKYESINYLLL